MLMMSTKSTKIRQKNIANKSSGNTRSPESYDYCQLADLNNKKNTENKVCEIIQRERAGEAGTRDNVSSANSFIRNWMKNNRATLQSSLIISPLIILSRVEVRGWLYPKFPYIITRRTDDDGVVHSHSRRKHSHGSPLNILFVARESSRSLCKGSARCSPATQPPNEPPWKLVLYDYPRIPTRNVIKLSHPFLWKLRAHTIRALLQRVSRSYGFWTSVWRHYFLPPQPRDAGLWFRLFNVSRAPRAATAAPPCPTYYLHLRFN